MVEDHRRVEPRAIVSGSGMVADPERIDELRTRAERYARDYAPKPEKAFAEVFSAEKKRREQEKQQDDPEEQRKREAAARRAEEEKQAIRRLLGAGTKHPGHATDKRKVALKG